MQNFEYFICNIEIYSIIFTAKEIVLELHFATVFHEIVCEKEDHQIIRTCYK